jgi:hypothetical protein
MAIEVLDKGMCKAMGRVEWDAATVDGQVGRLYGLGVQSMTATATPRTALLLSQSLGKVGGLRSVPTVFLTAFEPDTTPSGAVMSCSLESSDGIELDTLLVSCLFAGIGLEKLVSFTFEVFVRDWALIDTVIVPP